MDICSDIYNYVDKRDRKLLDIVVDRCEERILENEPDIERKAIKKLVQWMKKDFIQVVFIRDIHEITTDKIDLYRFLLKAKGLGVSIHSIDQGINISINETSDGIWTDHFP